MIILGNLTVCFGIFSYYRRRNVETILHYPAALLTSIIVIYLEYRHRKFLKKEISLAISAPKLSSDDAWKLLKSERLVVVLDDLLVDLTEYKWEHPGGAKMLD